MPKFSAYEKDQIQSRLLAEGHRLFATHGIKKVTIDDLAEAAHIAKASFYTFYAGKEYLYLDIVQAVQREIFTRLNLLLQGNVHLPSRERVRQVFADLYSLMLQYPILSQIDPDTVDTIARKVSPERLLVFRQQNIDAVAVLASHGVCFSCDHITASLAFQTLYRGWIGLQGSDPKTQEAVTHILLQGVIREIVVE